MSPSIKMVKVSPTVFNVNIANRAIVTPGAFSVITIFVMNGFLKIFFEKSLKSIKSEILPFYQRRNRDQLFLFWLERGLAYYWVNHVFPNLHRGHILSPFRCPLIKNKFSKIMLRSKNLSGNIFISYKL